VATQWRLTARGQAFLRGVTVTTTVVVAGLVLAAGMLTVVRVVAGPPATPTRTVTVHPGQTLWQIAGAAQPNTDLADTVARIQSLNHLESSTLHPGQILLVPTER